ncbi:Mut7-C RNAse domain-containing protein [Kitasatospora sp. HUAS MG31]|uniref:Mut7-C RNAse domain-containing protein n=1 Tax=Kitasatospora camelliae TaxID=3156397 RepID=A0AAU8K851_9ACTN
MELPAELRFFLRPRYRHGEVPVALDGTSTLGHLVEAAGVPLTEVGAMSTGRRAVGAAYRPEPGDRVRIEPVARPQPAPPRFLLDVHLGTLARRLRLLGVDAAYRNDLDDEELVRRANAEQRVLLTRDRGLLHRRALRLGAHVRGTDPDEQLADVLDRFAPPLRPWTRCPACNGPLAPVPMAAVAHLLPPGTRRRYRAFVRCRDCGRPYWHGAHHQRLDAIVAAAAAGRPYRTVGPGGPGSVDMTV